MPKAKMLALRKSVSESIRDPEVKKALSDAFKEWPIKDRFALTTDLLIDNIEAKSDFTEEVDEAVEKTKKWFKKSELSEFQRLLDENMTERRNRYTEILESYNPELVSFSTAKKHLRIAIKDYIMGETKFEPAFNEMQAWVISAYGEVRLYQKAPDTLYLHAFNALKWYWDVTKRDIWEAAYLNKPIDERSPDNVYRLLRNAEEEAKSIIESVRNLSPEMKAMGPEKKPVTSQAAIRQQAVQSNAETDKREEEQQRVREAEQRRRLEEKQAAEREKWRAMRKSNLIAERAQMEEIVKENSGFFAALNQGKKKKKEEAQKRIAEIDETLKNL